MITYPWTQLQPGTQNNLMKFLIENGSNIEEKDFQGNTPIHIAAASDNDRIVKYLIQKDYFFIAENLLMDNSLFQDLFKSLDKICMCPKKSRCLMGQDQFN